MIDYLTIFQFGGMGACPHKKIKMGIHDQLPDLPEYYLGMSMAEEPGRVCKFV